MKFDQFSNLLKKNNHINILIRLLFQLFVANVEAGLCNFCNKDREKLTREERESYIYVECARGKREAVKPSKDSTVETTASKSSKRPTVKSTVFQTNPSTTSNPSTIHYKSSPNADTNADTNAPTSRRPYGINISKQTQPASTPLPKKRLKQYITSALVQRRVKEIEDRIVANHPNVITTPVPKDPLKRVPEAAIARPFTVPHKK